MLYVLLFPLIVHSFMSGKQMKEGMKALKGVDDAYSIILDESNFTSAVIDSGEDWFINFCLTDSKSCTIFKPNWKSLAKRFAADTNSTVKIGFVELADGQNR